MIYHSSNHPQANTTQQGDSLLQYPLMHLIVQHCTLQWAEYLPQQPRSDSSNNHCYKIQAICYKAQANGFRHRQGTIQPSPNTDWCDDLPQQAPIDYNNLQADNPPYQLLLGKCSWVIIYHSSHERSHHGDSHWGDDLPQQPPIDHTKKQYRVIICPISCSSTMVHGSVVGTYTIGHSGTMHQSLVIIGVMNHRYIITTGTQSDEICPSNHSCIMASSSQGITFQSNKSVPQQTLKHHANRNAVK